MSLRARNPLECEVNSRRGRRSERLPRGERPSEEGLLGGVEHGLGFAAVKQKADAIAMAMAAEAFLQAKSLAGREEA